MHRVSVPLSIVVVVLLGLVGAMRGGTSGMAQEGTPEAEVLELEPGVTLETLRAGQADWLDPLNRLRFAPGAELTSEGDPSLSLVFVEAEALAVAVDVPVAVHRAGAAGQPPEAVAADEEFAAAAGDYFVVPPSVTLRLRNDGTEEAAILVSSILPVVAATPGPGTPDPA